MHGTTLNSATVGTFIIRKMQVIVKRSNNHLTVDTHWLVIGNKYFAILTPVFVLRDPIFRPVVDKLVEYLFAVLNAADKISLM